MPNPLKPIVERLPWWRIVRNTPRIEEIRIANRLVSIAPRWNGTKPRTSRRVFYRASIIYPQHGSYLARSFSPRLPYVLVTVAVNKTLSKTVWSVVARRPISKRVHYTREKARSIIVLVRLDQTREKEEG